MPSKSDSSEPWVQLLSFTNSSFRIPHSVFLIRFSRNVTAVHVTVGMKNEERGMKSGEPWRAQLQTDLSGFWVDLSFTNSSFCIPHSFFT